MRPISNAYSSGVFLFIFLLMSAPASTSNFTLSRADSGDMFSKLKLKCPINTKASIISNDLLRFYGLDKQYPCFTIGDKINTVLLKNNPYKIDVIGLNGFNDAPQILDIAKKYIDKDGLFDSIIRNKLENIYQDLGWSLSLNPHIDKFSLYEI